MMKRIAYIILAALALAVFPSCNGGTVVPLDEAFTQRELPGLVVGRKDMIPSISPEDLQVSYNLTKHIFRVGNGENSEYIVLVLKSNPSREGTTEGNLILRSSSLSRTYSSLNLAVLKTTDEYTWLWDSTQKVGVVIKTGLE